MTTATATTSTDIIEMLTAQVAALSQQLASLQADENADFSTETTLRKAKRLGKPVNQRRKSSEPLPVHSESQHVQALKDGKKAKKGRESKKDIKPGKAGFEVKKERKQTALRSDFIDAAVANPKALDKLECLTYRELQAVCKELNVSGKGSKDDLILRCLDHEKNQKTTKTAEKRTWEELSYRQTQRLVKWYRENVPNELDFVRNTGWDNVATNADMVMDCAMFWEYMDKKEYRTQLNTLLETSFIDG